MKVRLFGFLFGQNLRVLGGHFRLRNVKLRPGIFAWTVLTLSLLGFPMNINKFFDFDAASSASSTNSATTLRMPVTIEDVEEDDDPRPCPPLPADDTRLLVEYYDSRTLGTQPSIPPL